VLLDTMQDNRIAGYFTISNTSLLPAEMPAQIAKKLNRYDRWGAVKLGRMARHDDFPNFGLGDILLTRAFSIALSVAEQSGSLALVVDAKNERLGEWYTGAGFQAFPDTPLRLFIVNLAMAAYLETMAGF